MKDDKKKVATIIISKMKNGEEKSRMAPESDGAEIADSDELMMVADEIMKAVKSGDVKALKEGLQAMIECCSNMEPKEDEESKSYED